MILYRLFRDLEIKLGAPVSGGLLQLLHLFRFGFTFRRAFPCLEKQSRKNKFGAGRKSLDLSRSMLTTTSRARGYLNYNVKSRVPRVVGPQLLSHPCMTGLCLKRASRGLCPFPMGAISSVTSFLSSSSGRGAKIPACVVSTGFWR